MKVTVAIAQASPVVLDLAGSVAKACEWIGESRKAQRAINRLSGNVVTGLSAVVRYRLTWKMGT